MRKKRIAKAVCIIMAMISLLGSTAVVTSAATPQPRYGEPMYVIAQGGLNVRKNPGLSSRVVATLSYGTPVSVSTYMGTKVDGYTWFLIDSPVTGYVALEYLSYTRPRSIVIDITQPSVG